MKAVIIGAGRGSRLGSLTDEVPKTMVSVLGRPMLDWITDALRAGGFEDRDIVFIAGYQADVVKRAYPGFTYVLNEDWENNNILLSLACARDHLKDGFVSTYADIVYRPSIVERLVQSSHDLTLVCDTDFRRRYDGRTEHPVTDAEKMSVEGERVSRISRRIPEDQADGEFIGVMRATANGAAAFFQMFDEAKAAYAGGPYREGRSFEKAYLIDLLAHGLEQGMTMHAQPTDGGYMEIDTQQDRELAARWWNG